MRDPTADHSESIRLDEAETIRPRPRPAPAAFSRLDEAPTLRPDGAPVLLAGRYRIVRQLGQGGMGSVWLAEDAKLDNRPVAVKMLPAVLAGKAAFYRQVKDEALMAMRLSHSNIATVRAFEEDEAGNPFLVMDYVEGRALDDFLAEKGPLPPGEAVRLLSPVAAALDYAHAQGVVHRDVKPGNVIVRTDGTPFVLDFGIASEIRETMTRVTGKSSGGTLLYMSPEQLNGDAPKAAHDVYAFAAMAYECLAGHPPFFRGGIEDQIKHKDPEPLPDSIPAPLRNGIMAGLSKTAAGRPAACAGVLGREDSAAPDSGTSENAPAKPGETHSSSSPESRTDDSDSAPAREAAFQAGIQAAKAFREASRTFKTKDERAELQKIRQLLVEGETEIREGRESAALELFEKAESAIRQWQQDVAKRKGSAIRQREQSAETRAENAQILEALAKTYPENSFANLSIENSILILSSTAAFCFLNKGWWVPAGEAYRFGWRCWATLFTLAIFALYFAWSWGASHSPAVGRWLARLVRLRWLAIPFAIAVILALTYFAGIGITALGTAHAGVAARVETGASWFYACNKDFHWAVLGMPSRDLWGIGVFVGFAAVGAVYVTSIFRRGQWRTVGKRRLFAAVTGILGGALFRGVLALCAALY